MNLPGSAVAEGAGLHRLLVESVRDYAIFALDAEGHVLSWNAGAERLKGYAPEEIIGRHFSTFYPRVDLEAGKPAWELETAARDGSVEDEGWRIRKDGTRFWANVVITALRDEAGTLVGFAKVTRDLTERRRAEDLLRQSEERFRLLVQSVRDYAIFMLDPDGVVVSWNTGAERIKGYTPDEIIGRHFSVFYPPADLEAGKPQWELETAQREGRCEDEGWRVRKDGSVFWASVLIAPLHGSDGTLIGFAKVTRDLTERRAAQERLMADERRIAEAEAASRARSEFLAAMSHELRTPINATLGYTELMEMEVAGSVTPRQREYLGRIRSTQQHLLGIVTDLLNYSRIEAGQVEYDLAPVPVGEIIGTVLPMVEPQALAKGIALVRGPCATGLMAVADRAKAQQIVLNLLGNAVKFTPAGGSVTIGCALEGALAVITVADTGEGIEPEHQAAIFEPFVQLGRSLTSGHEGTGLGLAISRDLARAMGGDLTVRSTPGEGSVFTLCLCASV
ncbi:MAG TPA: PAS domain-containing sensor histidine kinase [Longimicrobium sp.]|jgi:PAS domain S-box-containing protein